MKIFAIALCATLSATSAQALVIQAYDATAASGGLTAFQSGPGVVSDALTRGSGIAQPSGGTNPQDYYRSTGFGAAGAATSYAQAVSYGDYLEWGFTSSVGYTLDRLDFAYGRSANGPQSMSLVMSLDDGVTWDLLFTDASVQQGLEEASVVGLSSSYVDVTDASFRMVAWNATATTGNFRLGDSDDFLDGPSAAVVLQGAPTAVPVPAALPALGAGLAALGLVARRRRRS